MQLFLNTLKELDTCQIMKLPYLVALSIIWNYILNLITPPLMVYKLNTGGFPVSLSLGGVWRSYPGTARLEPVMTSQVASTVYQCVPALSAGNKCHLGHVIYSFIIAFITRG